ncbi:hypothetical protein HYH03_003566 [Edaphochlamys debaryana]|uniref:Uncharacterized protein n=1 Tax=Edaphochlamys debaryana TaxID=47281 RepID=A0A835YGK3_9CHLO|nr:hypothetical protein HYH03_003566 [Edaphochlamys debaryana]|eukprot:KAG2498305.1 hypothetical protein HYH03_003566 [Edaphochlamys debaryana]
MALSAATTPVPPAPAQPPSKPKRGSRTQAAATMARAHTAEAGSARSWATVAGAVDSGLGLLPAARSLSTPAPERAPTLGACSPQPQEPELEQLSALAAPSEVAAIAKLASAPEAACLSCPTPAERTPPPRAESAEAAELVSAPAVLGPEPALSASDSPQHPHAGAASGDGEEQQEAVFGAVETPEEQEQKAPQPAPAFPAQSPRLQRVTEEDAADLAEVEEGEEAMAAATPLEQQLQQQQPEAASGSSWGRQWHQEHDDHDVVLWLGEDYDEEEEAGAGVGAEAEGAQTEEADPFFLPCLGEPLVLLQRQTAAARYGDVTAPFMAAEVLQQPVAVVEAEEMAVEDEEDDDPFFLPCLAAPLIQALESPSKGIGSPKLTSPSPSASALMPFAMSPSEEGAICCIRVARRARAVAAAVQVAEALAAGPPPPTAMPARRSGSGIPASPPAALRLDFSAATLLPTAAVGSPLTRSYAGSRLPLPPPASPSGLPPRSPSSGLRASTSRIPTSPAAAPPSPAAAAKPAARGTAGVRRSLQLPTTPATPRNALTVAAAHVSAERSPFKSATAARPCAVRRSLQLPPSPSAAVASASPRPRGGASHIPNSPHFASTSRTPLASPPASPAPSPSPRWLPVGRAASAVTFGTGSCATTVAAAAGAKGRGHSASGATGHASNASGKGSCRPSSCGSASGSCASPALSSPRASWAGERGGGTGGGGLGRTQLSSSSGTPSVSSGFASAGRYAHQLANGAETVGAEKSLPIALSPCMSLVEQ